MAIAFFCNTFARGQTISTQPPAQPKSLEREFFKNVLRDQKAIWTSPLGLKRQDAKWLVPSVIGFGALITTDRITGDAIGKHDRQVKASRAISHIGSLYSLAGFAGTFYLIGRQSTNARARETGLLSAEALLDSVIVSGALKGVSQRVRPLGGEDRSEFFEGGSSFPSGHSIQVWSVATLVAQEYKQSRVIQVTAYGLASAVSVARFTAHKHYLSDVLVGSALGYGIGRYVYGAHNRKADNSSDLSEPGGNKPSVTIMPIYNRRVGQYGIALSWSH